MLHTCNFWPNVAHNIVLEPMLEGCLVSKYSQEKMHQHVLVFSFLLLTASVSSFIYNDIVTDLREESKIVKKADKSGRKI